MVENTKVNIKKVISSMVKVLKFEQMALNFLVFGLKISLMAFASSHILVGIFMKVNE